MKVGTSTLFLTLLQISSFSTIFAQEDDIQTGIQIGAFKNGPVQSQAGLLSQLCKNINATNPKSFLISLDKNCIKKVTNASQVINQHLANLPAQLSPMRYSINDWTGYSIQFLNTKDCIKYFTADKGVLGGCMADQVVKNGIHVKPISHGTPTSTQTVEATRLAKRQISVEALDDQGDISPENLKTASKQTSVPGPPIMDFLGPPGYGMDKNSPWELDRITRRRENVPQGTFYYTPSAGKGVTIYIVDTGVQINHIDFSGRAVWGVNTVVNDPVNKDLSGHGTQIASVAAGIYAGAAKNATIVAVKVLSSDTGGKLSEVIAGLEWIGRDMKRKGNAKRSVINVSLGAPRKYPTWNDALLALARTGAQVVVSAGNEGLNSCDVSPASASVANVTMGGNFLMTVAGTLSANTIGPPTFGNFNNFGKCVTINSPGGAEPGVGLLAAVMDPTANNMYDGFEIGSSLAAGLTSGVCALMISGKKIPTGWSCKQYLIKRSTKGIVQGLPPDTPNLFLFSTT